MAGKTKAADTGEKVEKKQESDGKVQISFRLLPEEVSALTLIATLRNHASGPVNQNRFAVIKDALSRLVESDESLHPFESRLAALLDYEVETE